MKRRFHIAIAMIISSMFFGLYHGNLVQGVYGFAMGLLMCMACEYVHSVMGAFLMHSAANLTVYLLGRSGVLMKIHTPVYCILFLGIGCATILVQVIYPDLRKIRQDDPSCSLLIRKVIVIPFCLLVRRLAVMAGLRPV